jgi:hypothetical protein
MTNPALADNNSAPRYIMPLFMILMLAIAAASLTVGLPHSAVDPSAYMLTSG